MEQDCRVSGEAEQAEARTGYSPLPFLPMRLRGVFGVAWQLFRRGFFSMLGFLVAMLALPSILSGIVLYRLIALDGPVSGIFPNDEWGELLGFLGALLLLWALYALLVLPLVNGVLYLEMEQRMHGRSGRLRQLFRFALPAGLRLYPTQMAQLLVSVGLGIVVFLISTTVTPVFTVAILPGLMPFGRPGAAFIALSALLLLFVFLLTMLGELFPSLTLPAAIHGRYRGFSAVGRSFRLTAAFFLRAGGITLLFYALLLAVGGLLYGLVELSFRLDYLGLLLLSLILPPAFLLLLLPYQAAFHTALHADLSARMQAGRRADKQPKQKRSYYADYRPFGPYPGRGAGEPGNMENKSETGWGGNVPAKEEDMNMNTNIPARAEVDAAATWDLSPLFLSPEAWEEGFQAAAKEAEAFAKLAGTLCESPQALLHVLETESKISLMIERLYVFAHMRRDEDNAVTEYQAMTDRAMQLMAAFGASSAFLAPEILEIPEETFNAWVEGDVLRPFRRVLKNLARDRAHTLSAVEERLLALASEPLMAADQIFTMLNNADLRFGMIEDEDGKSIELSQENYRRYVESQNRTVREAAYRTLYKAYGALKNTLSASYTASVKADVFLARARKHESAIEAALFPADVPLSVYDGLIAAVEGRLGTLQEYLELRRRILGLDQLSMFDLYVPIVKEAKRPMEYREAYELVERALAPLGPDYTRLLKQADSERWIDVYENRGKTTGAYSWGAYGTHPYVLLNYQRESDYVFTLAHELGHAMHTYYSDSALPYQDAQYRIMAAEVASTVNEVLLLKYMLSVETDETRRAYLINHYLEQFRTTVFRQTMFASFEQQAHAMCEAGGALTVESLCDLYGKLNETYYPGVVVDDEIRLEWARIPHFYNAFYVYQYATGFCAAVKLAQGILAGGEALDRYLAFLKSGGSDFPIVLLQHAGVDLTDPNSILASLDEFEASVKELAGMV